MEIFIRDISHINGKKEKRLFAHTLLNNILEQKIGKNFEIIRPKNSKPYIKGNPVYFNLSHSKDLLAIGIAHFELGIDIEYMKKRDFATLSKHHFDIKIHDKVTFYKHWTEFEAGIKLHGLSIFNHKKLNPTYLQSMQIGNYMLSVATDNYFTLSTSSLEIDATAENI